MNETCFNAYTHNSHRHTLVLNESVDMATAKVFGAWDSVATERRTKNGEEVCVLLGKIRSCVLSGRLCVWAVLRTYERNLLIHPLVYSVIHLFSQIETALTTHYDPNLSQRQRINVISKENILCGVVCAVYASSARVVTSIPLLQLQKRKKNDFACLLSDGSMFTIAFVAIVDVFIDHHPDKTTHPPHTWKCIEIRASVVCLCLWFVGRIRCASLLNFTIIGYIIVVSIGKL